MDQDRLRDSAKEMLFSFRQRTAQLRRAVWRPALPAHAEKWVHLGCGDVDRVGFINVDGYPRRHVHFVRPIDTLPIFGDNTIDFMYASHALEHFPHRKIRRVLREWHRVLKPGGRLCLSVPDFDVIVRIYEDANRDIDSILQPLMGAQDYRYNFHYIAFNRESLTRHLLNAGFRRVTAWVPGSDDLHNFDDWSGRSLSICGKDYPISLNLEATK